MVYGRRDTNMSNLDAGWAYAVAPIIGYIAAGSLKFFVNSFQQGRPAFHAIGLGGIPSTHTTIVATVATVIAAGEGIFSASFSIAFGLSLVVIIDAIDLRRKIGSHAVILRRNL